MGTSTCLLVRCMRSLLALGLVCFTTLIYQRSLIYGHTDGGFVIPAGSYNKREFLVDTPGCHIPDLPPVSRDLGRFFRFQEPDPKCEEKWCAKLRSSWYSWSKNVHPPLVQSNLTAMWMVREAMHHYNIDDLSHLACCYRTFSRAQEDPDNYTVNADLYSRYIQTNITDMTLIP